jgi:hypothetical protein
MNIPASANKHRTVPSGSSGMFGKPGAPHREHKHPCPVFPGTEQATQAHNAAWQKWSNAREAAKGDSSEHICTVKTDMSSDFVRHMPIITDLIQYKPNVLDVLDQKKILLNFALHLSRTGI